MQNLLIYIQSLMQTIYSTICILSVCWIICKHQRVPQCPPLQRTSLLAPRYSCTCFLPSWHISFGSCHPRLMHQHCPDNSSGETKKGRLGSTACRFCAERGHSSRRCSHFLPFCNWKDWGNSIFAYHNFIQIFGMKKRQATFAYICRNVEQKFSPIKHYDFEPQLTIVSWSDLKARAEIILHFDPSQGGFDVASIFKS